jgi:hypothetical protein
VGCQFIRSVLGPIEEVTTYEKVVIRNPVKPNVAVQAGKRSLARLTTRMTIKQSQNPRPRTPPSEPMFKVATAMFALNLHHSLYISSELCD